MIQAFSGCQISPGFGASPAAPYLLRTEGVSSTTVKYHSTTRTLHLCRSLGLRDLSRLKSSGISDLSVEMRCTRFCAQEEERHEWVLCYKIRKLWFPPSSDASSLESKLPADFCLSSLVRILSPRMIVIVARRADAAIYSGESSEGVKV